MSVTGARLRQIVTAMAISFALVAMATQCSSPTPERAARDLPMIAAAEPDDDLMMVEDEDAGARALAVSRLLVKRAELVVIVGTDELTASVTEVARTHGVPVFEALTPDLADELARLETTTALTVGEAPPTLGTVDLVPVDLTRLDTELTARLDGATVETAGDGTVILTRDPAADALAAANAPAATVVAVTTGDPRTDPAAAASLRGLGELPTILLGSGWTDPKYTLDVVRSQPELPGGGYTIFPGRHIVALYGSPDTPALGLLGEQEPAAAVTRARELVAHYASLDARPVVGAFEIIATIASADPEPDGDYSRELEVATLRPLVDAAADAGMFVILDLQPGRSDFLTQAKRYEDLLLEPHVGLALDPEWRLGPDQVHLRQIGTVDGTEIDAVSAWLATLVRDNGLPQKLFVLHQFTPSMITNRHLVQTTRPQLQTVIHVDGQGTPGGKAGTWAQIRDGADPAIAWGWKNFLDEDQPMLTPEQTWAVTPRPDLVTYQ